jgi:hypothetical protein
MSKNMTQKKLFQIILCPGLILALSVNGYTLAYSSEPEIKSANKFVIKPRDERAHTLPIGQVESEEVYRINGHVKTGRQDIWNYDTIESGADHGLKVIIKKHADLRIKAHSNLQLRTDTESGGENQLHIDLRAGQLIVALDRDTVGIVKSGRQVAEIKTTRRTRVSHEQSGIKIENVEQGVQRYQQNNDVIECGILIYDSSVDGTQDPVKPLKKTPVVIKPVDGITSMVYAQTRTSRSQALRVIVTDDNDDPVPDVPVLFMIAGRSGKISQMRVLTDSRGIASTLFESPTKGLTNVTASVEGTNISTNLPINVGGAGLSIAAIMAIAAIAIGGAVIAAVAGDDDPKPPPPPPPPPLKDIKTAGPVVITR